MKPAAAFETDRNGEARSFASDVTRAGDLSVRIGLAGERLDALRLDWDRLANRASEPNPFCESWFIAPSVRHLPHAEVRLAEVRDGGTLVGLMPLALEPNYGRVPLHHVQNWRHHHLFLGTPLVQAGQEQAFWRALLLALDEDGWASGFLHVRDLAEDGPVHRGLIAAAAELKRPAAVVYRESRALLHSSLSPGEYYERTVRKKKRKELGRLKNRLVELGPITTRTLSDADDLSAWCDEFLELEQAGWKGKEGTALSCRAGTESFFRQALAGAQQAGRLQFLRLDLVNRPLAMLVNFLTPPGSFSFKTAFDEDFARFSPGVLLQIDNLNILAQPGIAWMDSCAAEQHPMIESIWGERRSIVRVTVPLRGMRRRIAYTAARTLEEASAARRRLVRKAQPEEVAS